MYQTFNIKIWSRWENRNRNNYLTERTKGNTNQRDRQLEVNA